MATSYRTIHTLDAHHVADLLELYRHEWWTNARTADEVRTLLVCSDLVIGFCDEKNNQLIAFARVLTDQVFRAFIFDVIVAADHRGSGLGHRLMTELLAHPMLRSVELVELYCRPALVAFYESLGFTTPDSRLGLLRRRVQPTPEAVSSS